MHVQLRATSIYRLFTRFAVMLAMIMISGVGVRTAIAKTSVAIPGSTWATNGIFSIGGHGGTTQLEMAGSVFFGPQTVMAQSGTTMLAANEIALILSDEINEAQLLGSYTLSKKGKLTAVVLQPP